MAKQLIHSSYLEDRKRGLSCTHAVVKDTETGETEIKTFKNKKMSVWITKPHLQQGQNTKLLCEKKENLDRLIVDPCYMVQDVGRHLFPDKRYVRYGQVMNSPYVYGADIPMEVRIKQRYLQQSEDRVKEYSVSALDFETSVLPPAEINGLDYGAVIISSYCDTTGQIHQYVNVDFLVGIDLDTAAQKIGNEFLKDFQYLYDNCNAACRKVLDKYKPTLTVHLIENEREVLVQTCRIHHVAKADFCSIWNIDFDVPKLLDRMDVHQMDHGDYLCHPDIPPGLRVCEYHKDNNKNLQHPTHAWHFFECSGFTQFYDAMGLYVRLRKHKGVLDSASLEAIATTILGCGKVDIEDKGHYIMQKFHKIKYCSYGAIDPLLNFCIEKVVNDIPSLAALTEYTHLRNFAQQTVMLIHRFFAYCLENGVVSGSQSGRMTKDSDSEIENVGGNVIHPGLALGTFANKQDELLRSIPEEWCRIVLMVSDLLNWVTCGKLHEKLSSLIAGTPKHVMV